MCSCAVFTVPGTSLTRCNWRLPSVLPPGELDETYASPLILSHLLHDVKTGRHPENRKDIMYGIAVKGGPNRGHWENLVKFGRLVFDVRTGRHTYRQADHNILH